MSSERMRCFRVLRVEAAAGVEVRRCTKWGGTGATLCCVEATIGSLGVATRWLFGGTDITAASPVAVAAHASSAVAKFEIIGVEADAYRSVTRPWQCQSETMKNSVQSEPITNSDERDSPTEKKCGPDACAACIETSRAYTSKKQSVTGSAQ
jgi:hypothetical protein